MQVRVDTVYLPCPVKICSTVVWPSQIDTRLAKVEPNPDNGMWLRLDSLAEADYLGGGGILGAMVMRLRDTLPLWSRLSDTRMLPASTQKLWTAAAGLSELGPHYRWRTTLWAQGRIEAGILHGNLILEGGGDPTLGTTDGPGLTSFANALTKLGVVEVRGNLVALDTCVGRGPDAWPQGWTISSSRDGYGAPVLGLNWNQNRNGDRAFLEPRPEALKALRSTLSLRKILVTGTDTTVLVRGDSVGPRRQWTRLGTVSSPELDDVVRVCLRESVNPYAEAILMGLGLGRARMNPRDAGRKRLFEWASRKGFEPWKMVLDDGSGLSRYDLVTARQMTRLLAIDLQGKPGSRLYDFMAKGGEGTLRRRFKELPDPSVVVAKTGTLDGVVNLVGVLTRPNRDTLAFAFLCGGYTGGARPVRKFQDRLIALLSGVPLMPIVPADTSADTTLARDSSRVKPVPPVPVPLVPLLPVEIRPPAKVKDSTGVGSAVPGTIFATSIPADLDSILRHSDSLVARRPAADSGATPPKSPLPTEPSGSGAVLSP